VYRRFDVRIGWGSSPRVVKTTANAASPGTCWTENVGKSRRGLGTLDGAPRDHETPLYQTTAVGRLGRNQNAAAAPGRNQRDVAANRLTTECCSGGLDIRSPEMHRRTVTDVLVAPMLAMIGGAAVARGDSATEEPRPPVLCVWLRFEHPDRLDRSSSLDAWSIGAKRLSVDLW